ncbi:MAG: oxidoreductase C-terminal domain-containing protein [Anaerolineae bacterium]
MGRRPSSGPPRWPQHGRRRPSLHYPPHFFSDLFDLSFEVWGDLSAWDQTVARGSLEDRTIAYYYFADGKLTGVLAMGRPEAEREPMQALVKARPAYDDVADHFADQSTDLQDLL